MGANVGVEHAYFLDRIADFSHKNMLSCDDMADLVLVI
jgi:hypothetical protein